MRALSGVLMFIQAGAVEIRQPEPVSGKMCGHPVQYHADPVLVHHIHEIHEIFRRAVTAGRRIIAGHLIAPGLIQRMLHDRHEFNMCIPHFLYIISQHRRQFPIIVKFPVFFLRASPGAQMHLIDKHGPVRCIRFLPALKPRSVLPLISADVTDHRSVGRP